MNNSTRLRPLFPSEREFLEQLLKSAPTTAQRCKQGIENAVVLWAVQMLLCVAAWIFIAWLARIAMHWEIGTDSSAAKLFQEPEHDGLIYFLHTSGGQVLVLYDDESQDLGAGGENPFGSAFKPAADFSIVRAPNVGVVISKQFSGTPLNAGEPFELTVDPEQWPEPDAYCDIPWDELEIRFSSSADV
ncbi:MAG: hypothetical protein ACU837_15925 [Gammaproteobacteria bacterium]